jgi:hypothetical protein
MKLVSSIYCLLFTLCPVFASEHPSDPINNYEIEKQRRSELSLLNDVPNIEKQKAMLFALRNSFEIEKRRRSELFLLNDLSGAGNFLSSLELSLLNDVPNIDQEMAEMKELRIRLQNLQVAINAYPALSGSNKSTPIEFKSELFKSGKLIYSDDFNGAVNKEFWGQPKGKKIKDGILTVGPLFKSKEEAMKALKRDHHLGLEPVAHINRIPEKFVMHLRYQFAKPELTPGRPSFQIGHHMINLGIVKDGGHRVKLPDGPSFFEPESDMALNKWIDLVIEYELGKIRVLVNGHGNTYEHEKVTIINPKDKLGPRFTFKGGPECEILFDYVRLWDCTD